MVPIRFLEGPLLHHCLHHFGEGMPVDDKRFAESEGNFSEGALSGFRENPPFTFGQRHLKRSSTSFRWSDPDSSDLSVGEDGVILSEICRFSNQDPWVRASDCPWVSSGAPAPNLVQSFRKFHEVNRMAEFDYL